MKCYKSVHFKVLILIILNDAEIHDKLLILTYKKEEFILLRFCRFVKELTTLAFNVVILAFVNETSDVL